MRHRSVCALPVFLSLWFAAPAARAQQANLAVVPCPRPVAQFLETFEVDVIIQASVASISSLYFKVVPPASGDLSYMGYSSQFLTTGDPLLGVRVDMPTCQPPGTVVVTLRYVYLGQGTNEFVWLVRPVDGHADIELTDCDDFPMKGAGADAWWDPCEFGNQGYLAPYKPSPPDGAVDVPTDALLSFVGPHNGLVFLEPTGFVFCSSDPYPELYPDAPACSRPPIDPGPLLPNTTYRWYVWNVCWGCADGGGSQSDEWTFTTADAPTTTQATTWGAIKALYRD